MSDEYSALTMVLLRLLAFPPAGGQQAMMPAARSAPGVAAGEAGRRSVAVERPVQTAPTPGPAPSPAARPAPPPAAPAASPERPLAQPVTSVALRAAEEPPPWLDDPPDEDAVPEPRTAPLRTAAAPAISLPVPLAAERGAALAEMSLPAALGERWSALVRRLAEAGSIGALVRELAWQGGLREVDEAAVPALWTLVVERESLRSPALRDKLAAALTAELGAALELRIEPGVPGDSPARRDQAERQRRQAEAEATIGNDPLVTGLLAQFKGARIVPGSIKPV